VVDTNPSVVVDEPKPTDTSTDSLARYYVELGDLYFQTRRYLRATETYARAAQLVPDDAALRFVIADAWFAVGQYDKAAYAIRQGLHLDPELAASETDKRGFYGFAEDFDKHMKALAKHLDERPLDAQALLVEAYNLRFSGGYIEARKKLEKLSEILPGDPAIKQLREGLDKAAAARTPRKV
jgi:tetratricopeptide (TPR) repeat protein